MQLIIKYTFSHGFKSANNPEEIMTLQLLLTLFLIFTSKFLEKLTKARHCKAIIFYATKVLPVFFR